MALRKTIEKNLDTDQLRAEAAAFAENVAEQAERAAEWVAPHVVKARADLARVAKDAHERLEPAYVEARQRVVDDYLPRAQRAANAAHAAAQSSGTVAERAQRAAEAARLAATEVPQRPKSHRVLKTFGWLTLATGVAAAAYVVWRHSQPVEDPWAEEYWADAAEDVAETARDVVDDAKDTADDLVDGAKDAIDDAKDAAKDLADKAKDAVSDAADK